MKKDRLSGINDNGRMHQFTYDAAGERVIKSSGDSQNVAINGQTAATIVHTDGLYRLCISLFCNKQRKITSENEFRTIRIN